MNWEKAIENVRTLIPLYEEIGFPGIFGLSLLKEYIQRYEAGERTQELYEVMIHAE